MIRLGSFCVRRRVTGVTFSPSSDTKKIPTELSAPLIRIRSPSISMSSFGVIEPLDNPVKVSVTMPMRPTSDLAPRTSTPTLLNASRISAEGTISSVSLWIAGSNFAVSPPQGPVIRGVYWHTSVSRL